MSSALADEFLTTSTTWAAALKVAETFKITQNLHTVQENQDTYLTSHRQTGCQTLLHISITWEAFKTLNAQRPPHQIKSLWGFEE